MSQTLTSICLIGPYSLLHFPSSPNGSWGSWCMYFGYRLAQLKHQRQCTFRRWKGVSYLEYRPVHCTFAVSRQPATYVGSPSFAWGLFGSRIATLSMYHDSHDSHNSHVFVNLVSWNVFFERVFPQNVYITLSLLYVYTPLSFAPFPVLCTCKFPFTSSKGLAVYSPSVISPGVNGATFKWCPYSMLC